MNFSMVFKKKKGGAVFILISALTLTSFSQIGSSEERKETKKNKLGLEEVVVTAQKREQSVSEIPSTVNVISEGILKDYSLFNFNDVEQITAGLTLTSENVRQNTVSMRGLTFNISSGAPSAVQTYWNGLPVGANMVFQQMFDLSRIEVLRGPQGTVQGRSSPSGAIMIVTRPAGLTEFEGEFQSSFSDNDGSNTQLGINIPIIEDKVGLRLSGVYDENNAQGIKSINTGTKQSSSTSAGRVSLLWMPVDSLDVNLAYEYLERSDNPFADVAGVVAGGPNIDRFDRLSVESADPIIKVRHQKAALTLNWDVAGHTLTSLTGNTIEFSYDVADNQITDNTINQFESVETKEERFTQEFRLASSLEENRSIDYLLGVYYSRMEAFTDFRQESLDFPSVIIGFDVPRRQEEFGVFSDNVLHITENFRTQVGLRWQKIRTFSRLDGSLFGFPFSLITDENQLTVNEEVTGGVKLQYDVNDDAMAYVSADLGYRPGGTTITSAPLNDDLLLYGDETSLSIELGVKASLFDQRLQVNGAVFRQSFKDFIGYVVDVPIDDLADDGFEDRRESFAYGSDITITGAEIELNAFLIENWKAGGNITYAHSTYDDGEEIPCAVLDAMNAAVIPVGSQTAFCDVGGKRVGGEPNLSFSINSQYSLSLGPVEGFVSGLYKFTDRRTNDDIRMDTSSYGVFNLYAGVRDFEGVWEISLWAKNLTDKEAERKLYTPRPTGLRQVSVIDERVIGITGKYSFSL